MVFRPAIFGRAKEAFGPDRSLSSRLFGSAKLVKNCTFFAACFFARPHFCYGFGERWFRRFGAQVDRGRSVLWRPLSTALGGHFRQAPKTQATVADSSCALQRHREPWQTPVRDVRLQRHKGPWQIPLARSKAGHARKVVSAGDGHFRRLAPQKLHRTFVFRTVL